MSPSFLIGNFIVLTNMTAMDTKEHIQSSDSERQQLLGEAKKENSPHYSTLLSYFPSWELNKFCLVNSSKALRSLELRVLLRRC